MLFDSSLTLESYLLLAAALLFTFSGRTSVVGKCASTEITFCYRSSPRWCRVAGAKRRVPADKSGTPRWTWFLLSSDVLARPLWALLRRPLLKRLRPQTMKSAALRRRQHRSKDLLVSSTPMKVSIPHRTKEGKGGATSHVLYGGKTSMCIPRRVENRVLHAHLFSSARLTAVHFLLYDSHSAKLQSNFLWLQYLSIVIREWYPFRRTMRNDENHGNISLYAQCVH